MWKCEIFPVRMSLKMKDPLYLKLHLLHFVTHPPLGLLMRLHFNRTMSSGTAQGGVATTEESRPLTERSSSTPAAASSSANEGDAS
ncbi:hypothetical protein LIER_12596 [Lithospermum erythrorhizon]|uniref:Uncharacterized protein n=1 Tax=Lithospermum erythrorhizon TaxID=34254 RepID=A0AAV3PWH1_LITER